MRDRTASHSYSQAGEEFRREHERHRAWGLTRRHAERLRRLRDRDCEPHNPTAEGMPPERQTPALPRPPVSPRSTPPDRPMCPTASPESPASQNPGVTNEADRLGRQGRASTQPATTASSRPTGDAPSRRAEKASSRPTRSAPSRPVGNAPDASSGKGANPPNDKRAAAPSGKCDVIHDRNSPNGPSGKGGPPQERHCDPAGTAPPRPSGQCTTLGRRPTASATAAWRRVHLRGPPGNPPQRASRRQAVPACESADGLCPRDQDREQRRRTNLGPASSRGVT
jgi:hypothetical protein